MSSSDPRLSSRSMLRRSSSRPVGGGMFAMVSQAVLLRNTIYETSHSEVPRADLRLSSPISSGSTGADRSGLDVRTRRPNFPRAKEPSEVRRSPRPNLFAERIAVVDELHVQRAETEAAKRDLQPPDVLRGVDKGVNRRREQLSRYFVAAATPASSFAWHERISPLGSRAVVYLQKNLSVPSVVSIVLSLSDALFARRVGLIVTGRSIRRC